MKVSPATKEILDKAFDGAILTREEILEILRIPLPPLEAGLVKAFTDTLRREASQGRPGRVSSWKGRSEMKYFPRHRLRTLAFMALGLLTAFYFLSPAEAGGTDWKFIENDHEGPWFFDSEMMEYLSDRLVRVQTKKIYKEKAVLAAVDKYGEKYENLDYVLVQWEIDCFQKKFKLCSAIFYSKENAVIERYDAEKEGCLTPEDIPFDSYLELLRKKVCR